MEMLYHTVREKYRAVPLPAAIARLLAKPREFLLGKVTRLPPPGTSLASLRPQQARAVHGFCRAPPLAGGTQMQAGCNHASIPLPCCA